MKTPLHRSTIAVLGLILALFGGGRLFGASVDTVSGGMETARTAQAAYEQGMLLRAADPAAARAAFEESADGWRRLITAGHANVRTWTNLGNAELGAGEVGESIAAYLEADRLAPGDRQVRTNLTAARNQVPARFDDAGVTVLYDTVSDGWHVLGFDARWWIAAVCWVGFWTILLVRINLRTERDDAERSEGGGLLMRAALIITGGIAVIATSTVALDLSEDAWRSPGVLVQDSVVRSGNGDSFSEVFSEALPEGVEFEVEETRPGWHRVRFADDRTGWVRSGHVKLISS